jgi:hypothetical protein
MTTITQALRLLSPAFPGSSWRPGFTFLKSLFGEPLDDGELELFKRFTGRQTAPTVPCREGWLCAGRRGGKSRLAALTAVYLGCFKDWTPHLSAGEKAVVCVLATNRDVSQVVLGYINGLIDSTPALAELVEDRGAEHIDLAGRVSIEVHTSSFRSIRGRTIAAAILDEVAYWRSEESANPDYEIVTALRPALETLRKSGALLLGISSPFAKRGVLFDAYRKHYGKDGDPVLVWKSTSRELNENISEETVEAALEEDPAAARAEWLAEFRRDIESFVSREAVEAVVVPGRFELPPSGFMYSGFCDAAGGSGQDSMTLGISHAEERNGEMVAVLDCVREVRPPFSPEGAVEEFAEVLKRYGIYEVVGDRYSGDIIPEQFRKRGIEYRQSEKTKSDIYKDLLPIINSGRCELLDDKRLIAQLCNLERRVARGGKESIDAPPSRMNSAEGHDDRVNASAGSLVNVSLGVSGYNIDVLLPGYRAPGEKPADTGTEAILNLVDAREVAARQAARRRWGW